MDGASQIIQPDRLERNINNSKFSFGNTHQNNNI